MHKAQGASFLGLVVCSKKSLEKKNKEKSEIHDAILYTIQSEDYCLLHSHQKMT